MHASLGDADGLAVLLHIRQHANLRQVREYVLGHVVDVEFPETLAESRKLLRGQVLSAEKDSAMPVECIKHACEGSGVRQLRKIEAAYLGADAGAHRQHCQVRCGALAGIHDRLSRFHSGFMPAACAA